MEDEGCRLRVKCVGYRVKGAGCIGGRKTIDGEPVKRAELDKARALPPEVSTRDPDPKFRNSLAGPHFHSVGWRVEVLNCRV